MNRLSKNSKNETVAFVFSKNLIGIWENTFSTIIEFLYNDYSLNDLNSITY